MNESIDPRSSAAITQADLRHDVGQVLRHLSPRLLQAITLRFGLDGHGERTLRGVGKAMKVSPERVRQLVCHGLAKVAREVRRRGWAVGTDQIAQPRT